MRCGLSAGSVARTLPTCGRTSPANCPISLCRSIGSERPAARAWCALGVGVVGYDVACPAGETLSEGADRFIGRHPYLARALVAVVALHVANTIPPSCDPIHRLFVAAHDAVNIKAPGESPDPGHHFAAPLNELLDPNLSPRSPHPMHTVRRVGRSCRW